MENIKWFGHASFLLTDENGNKIYYVDPFDLKVDNLEKADLVFITHAHSDHFSPQDLDKILKANTIVIATSDVLSKIPLEEGLKLKVVPSKNYEVKGFKFETVPAYNNHPERLNFHPKSNNWVGYIFYINNKKIYHAGDTDFIPEMKNLKNLNLDFALFPIGGHYTMGHQEAAEAANEVAAKITIPMHYKNIVGSTHPQIEEEFKKLVTNSRVVILEELR